MCWNQQKSQLDHLFKELQLRHKTLTYVNILEFLRFQSCVQHFLQHFRYIETRSNHVVTGVYVSNQSTDGGVRQQWCLSLMCVKRLGYMYGIGIHPRGGGVVLVFST